jgi:hypothetical protein
MLSVCSIITLNIMNDALVQSSSRFLYSMVQLTAVNRSTLGTMYAARGAISGQLDKLERAVAAVIAEREEDDIKKA